MSALLCSRHLGNLGCPCLETFKHNLVRAGADPSHLALVAARSGSGSGPVWSKHKFIESGFVPSRVRFASLASRSGSVGFRLRRETHRGCDNFCAPQQKIRRHIYIYIYVYGCVRLTLPSQRSVKSFVTDGARIGFASSGNPV